MALSVVRDKRIKVAVAVEITESNTTAVPCTELLPGIAEDTSSIIPPDRIRLTDIVADERVQVRIAV